MAKVISAEDLLKAKEKQLLETWMKAQVASITLREDLMSVEQLRKESIEFLRLFVKTVGAEGIGDISKPEFEPMMKKLQDISRSRAAKGFTPSETATYIFSLRDSILSFLQQEYKDDAVRLNTEVIRISQFLDKLGLVTFEKYTSAREEVIREQQETLFELSSPIVTLWDGVLAVPIIGVLDSKRTQQIMEGLLKAIVDAGAQTAIIDITGVAVMDTLVATHLLKTVAAVRLLGAEAVITGIRPEVAQTIVHLGVDLGDVITKATMAEGLVYAFDKMAIKVIRG